MKQGVRIYLKSGSEIDIECSTITETKESFETLLEGVETYQNEKDHATISGDIGAYIRYADVSAIKIIW